jgi:hypothetical protein
MTAKVIEFKADSPKELDEAPIASIPNPNYKQLALL